MKAAWLSLLALLLAACASPPPGCLSLAADGWYCPSFGALPAFETEQATTVRFRDQSMQLLTRIRSGEDGVFFVGISPLGQTLLSASWHDGILNAELPPGLKGRLDPALLPGLLELSLAPPDNVRRGLGGQLRVEESAGRRSISSANGEAIEIRWQGAALPYQTLQVRVPGLGLSIDSTAIAEEKQ